MGGIDRRFVENFYVRTTDIFRMFFGKRMNFIYINIIENLFVIKMMKLLIKCNLVL